MKLNIKMKFKKSTLHTHVFEEVLDLTDPNPRSSIIPTLYIRQISFHGAVPKELEIVVTYDE